LLEQQGEVSVPHRIELLKVRHLSIIGAICFFKMAHEQAKRGPNNSSSVRSSHNILGLSRMPSAPTPLLSTRGANISQHTTLLSPTIMQDLALADKMMLARTTTK
jgi:hypothetical protein